MAGEHAADIVIKGWKNTSPLEIFKSKTKDSGRVLHKSFQGWIGLGERLLKLFSGLSFRQACRKNYRFALE